MNITIANNTDTTVFLNGNMVPSKDYKFEGKSLVLSTELKEPYWCPGCLGTGFNRLPWGDTSFVCSNCGYQTFPDPIPPFLKEKDTLDLGWKHTPDTTDYAPLWTSYIKCNEDTCYELSNEDDDNVWGIQECDEKGNYVQDGENMFFFLYDKEDLKDLMRLMGLK